MPLALFALEVPRAAHARSGERPRGQALHLYHQKKYDQACPLFEKLATDAKVDGVLCADLGLCEFRRARDAAGQRASLLAVHYGDDAVRKKTYFNLYAFGYRARLPQQKSGDEISCEFLPPTPPFACEKKVWACLAHWSHYWTGGVTAGTDAFFGSDDDAMAALKAHPALRSAPSDSADLVPLSREQETFCGYCNAHAWECSTSKVVMPKVKQCFKKNTGAKGEPDTNVCLRRTPAYGKLCNEYMKCSAALCEQAQTAYESHRARWPEAADEIARAHNRCKDCGIQESKTCEGIAVDSCSGRVGYACRQEHRAKRGSLLLAS